VNVATLLIEKGAAVNFKAKVSFCGFTAVLSCVVVFKCLLMLLFVAAVVFMRESSMLRASLPLSGRPSICPSVRPSHS